MSIRIIRPFVILAAALLGVVSAPAAPAAAKSSGITLSADTVRFYSDKYLVTGDGGVVVTMPDGTRLTGEAFTMDLRLNRFNLAGEVTLDHGTIHLKGAGFADFIDFKRQYFLPLGAKPDRWTFLDGDYTKPLLGRQMPGDAFELAEAGGEQPYNRTHYATIYPRTGVSFGAGSAEVLLPLPVTLPVSSYYVNFASNPNFAQNGFAGADYDVGLPFIGNDHMITAVHFRHDPINHYYLSFDQHFVWGNHDWLVASVNPATTSQKQYNLIGVKQASPNVQFRGFEQFNTYQPGLFVFGSSQSAANYANFQTTVALKRSYFNLNADQYNTSLITQTYTPYDAHPADIKLSWIGTDKQLGGRYSPFRFALRSSYAQAYNGYGIGTFIDTPYKSVFTTEIGARVYLANGIRLAKGKPFFFNASYDRVQDYYSLPHHLDTATTTGSISYAPIGPRDKVNAFVAYQVGNYSDLYKADQSHAYAPSTIGGYYNQDIVAQLAAINYDGFSTSRTLTATAILKASPVTTVIASFVKHRDYPVPVPDIYGYPPYTASLGVRARVFPNVLLDVSRAYYFNFSNQYRWQPNFSIQVSN